VYHHERPSFEALKEKLPSEIHQKKDSKQESGINHKSWMTTLLKFRNCGQLLWHISTTQENGYY